MDEAPENVTPATASDHRPCCARINGATDLHLLLCAFHEAAHAVVGLAVGHGVDYAEVVTTGEQIGGYVEPIAPPWYVEGFAGGPGAVAASPRLRERLDEEQRAYLEQRIAVDLAGPLAERRFQQTRRSRFGPVGEVRVDEGDVAEAARRACWVLDADEARFGRLWGQAVTLVDRCWGQIEQVAWALHDAAPRTTPDGQRCYRLTGAQISALLAENVTPAPTPSLLFWLFADKLVSPSEATLFEPSGPGSPARWLFADKKQYATTVVGAAFWNLRRKGYITLEPYTKKLFGLFTERRLRASLGPEARYDANDSLEYLILLALRNRSPADVSRITMVLYAMRGDARTPYAAMLRLPEGEALRTGCMVRVDAHRNKVMALVMRGTKLEVDTARVATFQSAFETERAAWEQFKTSEPDLYRALLGQCAALYAARRAARRSGWPQ